MTDRIRFFEEASAEIEQERRWYRDRSEVAEESFLRELDHAIEVLLEAPQRWPRHIAGTRRYVLRKFPFSIVYFVEDDLVVVVSLQSERKRPGYWRGRFRKKEVSDSAHAATFLRDAPSASGRRIRTVQSSLGTGTSRPR